MGRDFKGWKIKKAGENNKGIKREEIRRQRREDVGKRRDKGRGGLVKSQSNRRV